MSPSRSRGWSPDNDHEAILSGALNSMDNIDVRDYGAVGDGIADDTAPIQTALNEAGATAVVIPDGVFRTSLLSLNDGQRVVVYGELRVLASVGGPMVSARGRTGIRIIGFGGVLTGNTVPSLTAVNLIDCEDAEVSGLRIVDVLNKGISVAGNSRWIRVFNNHVTGARGDHGAGISVNSPVAEHCTIFGNTVERSRIGITCNGGAHHTVQANVVQNSDVTGITLDGIVTDSGDGAKYCSVVGNVSEGARDPLHGGIHIGNGASYNTVSGNLSRGNGGAGIRIVGTPGFAPIHLTLSANVCADNAQTGIAAARMDYSVLDGNQSVDNEDRGIHVFLGADNVVSNNICRGNRGEGILIQSDRTTVTGNKCTGNAVGIASAPGGGSLGDNLLVANDVRGNARPGIVRRTSDRVRDNEGSTDENQGTATLLSGTTRLEVPHGLEGLPEIQDITVTPIAGWGRATQFWVSDVTRTHFSIRVDRDPRVDIDFAWTARRP